MLMVFLWESYQSRSRSSGISGAASASARIVLLLCLSSSTCSIKIHCTFPSVPLLSSQNHPKYRKWARLPSTRRHVSFPVLLRSRGFGTFPGGRYRVFRPILAVGGGVSPTKRGAESVY